MVGPTTVRSSRKVFQRVGSSEVLRRSNARGSCHLGTPGKPYDPCYHKACDTMINLNS